MTANHIKMQIHGKKISPSSLPCGPTGREFRRITAYAPHTLQWKHLCLSLLYFPSQLIVFCLCTSSSPVSFFSPLSFVLFWVLQIRTMTSAGGLDNLVMLDPAKYKARPQVPEPAGDGSATQPKWQVGEQEYEALMRMLDNLVSVKKNFCVARQFLHHAVTD